MSVIKLNCDLGESFGPYLMGQDAAVMPLIDMANIACGMHASDPVTLSKTVQLARASGAEIGAHPGYPDKEGFGRRAMAMSGEEIKALVQYQVAALDGVCRSEGARVSYVKPHGALYHAMMGDALTRQAIFSAVAGFWSQPDLVVLATEQREQLLNEAAEHGLKLRFEAFADRAYSDNGTLLPRSESGAVYHEQARVLAQAELIATRQEVVSASGQRISLVADTLCVHGDNQAALDSVKAIRQMLHKHQEVCHD